VIIDFSHGVRLDYPNANDLLNRDIENLKKYFKKHNINLDIGLKDN